ncbi:MAG TPA: hypothetical protein ENG42_02885, partial [Candidatus Aenigmarchaeota archaeon]|nr:hypothetical protein [Candidatus Aenigmarchaeota archaeon]
LEEEDFEGFHILKEELKDRLVIGDDLYCTNVKRLRKGIKNKSTNGIIIKPNQVGTLSQAEEVVKIAKENKITPIISHRSAETEDNWIADLAIAWRIPFIKTGIMGTERLSKLNRLIELWNSIPNVEMAKVW